MISVLIAIALAAAVVQFILYCRSALGSVRSAEVSGHVLCLAGLETRIPRSADFGQFAALLHVCPEHGREGSQMRAISLYFDLLQAFAWIGSLAPSISSWAEREQRACAHFAAVVLDRRISSSRTLLLQRAADKS